MPLEDWLNTEAREHAVQLIQQYPTLFKNKHHVYHYVLMVNGTGYEWSEDGRVVTRYGRPDNKKPQLSKELALELALDSSYSVFKVYGKVSWAPILSAEQGEFGWRNASIELADHILGWRPKDYEGYLRCYYNRRFMCESMRKALIKRQVKELKEWRPELKRIAKLSLE